MIPGLVGEALAWQQGQCRSVGSICRIGVATAALTHGISVRTWLSLTMSFRSDFRLFWFAGAGEDEDE